MSNSINKIIKRGSIQEQRPFSSKLVDLHVAVLPTHLWIEKLNYASHKVIGDTFSAGFIRVLPDTTIARLRQDISEQLGRDFFPEEYVFLKHVGRCLDLVRQTQERQLKVANFLPPQSIVPEIFVLPGQPVMYSYAVLPPIQPRLQDLHTSVPDFDESSLFRRNTDRTLDFEHSSYNTSNENGPTLRNSTPLSQTEGKKSSEQLAFFSESDDQQALLRSRGSLKFKLSKSSQKHQSKRNLSHFSGNNKFDNETDFAASTTSLSSEESGQSNPVHNGEFISKKRYNFQRVEGNLQSYVDSEREDEDAKSYEDKSKLNQNGTTQQNDHAITGTMQNVKELARNKVKNTASSSVNHDSGFVDPDFSESEKSFEIVAERESRVASETNSVSHTKENEKLNLPQEESFQGQSESGYDDSQWVPIRPDSSHYYIETSKEQLQSVSSSGAITIAYQSSNQEHPNLPHQGDVSFSVKSQSQQMDAASTDDRDLKTTNLFEVAVHSPVLTNSQVELKVTENVNPETNSLSKDSLHNFEISDKSKVSYSPDHFVVNDDEKLLSSSPHRNGSTFSQHRRHVTSDNSNENAALVENFNLPEPNSSDVSQRNSPINIEEETGSDEYESSNDEFQHELAKVNKQQLMHCNVSELEEATFLLSTPQENCTLFDNRSSLNSASAVKEVKDFLSNDGTEKERSSLFLDNKKASHQESMAASADLPSNVKPSLNTEDSFFSKIDSLSDVAENSVVNKLPEETGIIVDNSRSPPDGMPTLVSDKDQLAGNPNELIVSKNLEELAVVNADESATSTSSALNDKELQLQENSSKLEISETRESDEISLNHSTDSPVQHGNVTVEDENEETATPVPMKQESKSQTGEENLSLPTSNSNHKPVAALEGNARKPKKKVSTTERIQLWEDFLKVRSERRNMEKRRHELVNQARVTNSKINQKRDSVRDSWRKRFFEEKKKALPLEDTRRRLQAELDSSHRLLDVNENTDDSKKQILLLPPPIQAVSNKNNNRIQATKLQHDIDNLRRRIEEAKTRLTVEIKLRHQAEQDMKAMRQDLTTKKIRAHVAYRELSRLRPFTLKT